MVSKTKMCPSGHVIPAESVYLPYLSSRFNKRNGRLNGPSALTRVDFDLEATRAEDLAKTLLEEDRPFWVGWRLRMGTSPEKHSTFMRGEISLDLPRRVIFKFLTKGLKTNTSVFVFPLGNGPSPISIQMREHS